MPSHGQLLRPFVTVYAEMPVININTASREFIAALDDKMTDSLTNQVLDYRKNTPFQIPADLAKVAGMETIATGLTTSTTTIGTVYRIISLATVKETTRIVEAVVRVIRPTVNSPLLERILMNYLIVQLTGNEALFARFQLKRGVLVFDRASRETIDQEHPLAAMLAEAAAAGREGERVILVIPPALLSMREMELPLSDRRKIRDVLPLELKGETACDSEELVFDALPLDGGKFLAIWGKRHDLAEKIAIMTDNGLEPEIVTASLFHWHALLPEGESGGHDRPLRR